MVLTLEGRRSDLPFFPLYKLGIILLERDYYEMEELLEPRSGTPRSMDGALARPSLCLWQRLF